MQITRIVGTHLLQKCHWWKTFFFHNKKVINCLWIICLILRGLSDCFTSCAYTGNIYLYNYINAVNYVYTIYNYYLFMVNIIICFNTQWTRWLFNQLCLPTLEKIIYTAVSILWIIYVPYTYVKYRIKPCVHLFS